MPLIKTAGNKLIAGNGIFAVRQKGPSVPTVNIGGREYPYVQIGRQLWLAENLDYYNDNILIGGSSSTTQRRAYYYDNDQTNYGWDGLRLGLLYNRQALNFLVSNESTLFTDGWRIPSDDDISNLVNAAGGSSNAGDILSKGSLDWAPEWTGTNTLNFSLRPSGSRWGSDGKFHNLGTNGQFWSRSGYQNYREAGSSGFYATGPQYNYATSVPIRLCKDATVNIGGRNYPTTKIGNQIWLAENLDLKWDGLNYGTSGVSTSPKANYYNNDPNTYGESGNRYGLLYNWYAAKYLNDNRKSLCPGWHVPSVDELQTLIDNCGGSSTAGAYLKSTTGWISKNGNDKYGFTLFPTGGVSEVGGEFVRLGYYTCCQAITDVNNDMAYDLYITCWDDTATALDMSYKKSQWPIRLIKDA